LPRVLEELRNGTLHLTALFLLAQHLTENNAEALIAETRGKTRKEIERVLARWFPRPDVAAGIAPAFEQQELGAPRTTLLPASHDAPGPGNAPGPGAQARRFRSAPGASSRCPRRATSCSSRPVPSSAASSNKRSIS
jgi:hypothetical protein